MLGVVDPTLSDHSGDRLYLLDGFEGKRVAAPLELRDESKDEILTLYAPTTVVASSWRERLLSAKSAPNEFIRHSSVRRFYLYECPFADHCVQRLFRTRKIADLDSHPQCSTIICRSDATISSIS